MKPVWVALLTGFVALLVHAPASDGAFLWYDDLRFVVANPHLDDLSNTGRFFTDLDLMTSPEKTTSDIYRPLRTLAYAVLVNVFGRDPAAFHWTSILLHASCAMALFGLLARSGLGRWPAAAGALAFALHPATVETTAWVNSLGDAGCGLFALLAMLAYAHDRALPAFGALVVALLFKEHAVVVPGLFLAWDFFFRRERLRAGIVRGALPALAIVIGFLVFRDAVVGAGMAQVEGPLGGSFGAALLTMLAGLGWYAATVLFPYGPTFNARVPVQESLLALPVLAGVAVAAALVYGLVRGPRRTRFACAWFCMALVPVSNLFVTLKIPTADRFLYIPLMGLAFAAAELVRRAAPLSTRAVPAVLVALAALTVTRIGDWRDDESLVAAGLRVAPRDKMLLWAEAAALHNRAATQLERDRPELVQPLAARAEELYVKYLRNAGIEEQTEVWVEVGDLRFMVGNVAAAYAEDSRAAQVLYANAMDAYYKAWEFQKRGVGRVVDRQMRHTAERLVTLGRRLARPGNRNIGKTIEVTLDAADHLKKNYGVDDRWTRAVLRFVDSVVVRGHEPEKAKAGYVWVLRTLDELEAEGVRGTTYLRAQATFYLGIVGGRAEARKPVMEKAYHLYVRAAQEDPGVRLQGLLYAGRCACKIGQLFGDGKWMARAREIFRTLPEYAKKEGLTLTPEQARELETLERECR